ncbi:MAG: hypothetical protein R3C28_13190 [Pirellulaceae bacterium]
MLQGERSIGLRLFQGDCWFRTQEEYDAELKDGPADETEVADCAELHEQLLEMAQDLATKETPTQAELRRSVSTSYYALFHALGFEWGQIFDADGSICSQDV